MVQFHSNHKHRVPAAHRANPSYGYSVAAAMSGQPLPRLPTAGAPARSGCTGCSGCSGCAGFRGSGTYLKRSSPVDPLDRPFASAAALASITLRGIGLDAAIEAA